jgi:hypothetical protein
VAGFFVARKHLERRGDKLDHLVFSSVIPAQAGISVRFEGQENGDPRLRGDDAGG